MTESEFNEFQKGYAINGDMRKTKWDTYLHIRQQETVQQNLCAGCVGIPRCRASGLRLCVQVYNA